MDVCERMAAPPCNVMFAGKLLGVDPACLSFSLDPVITFEARPGDGLQYRAFVLDRFIQAVRKVIIRQRVQARLERMAKFQDKWRLRVYEESFGGVARNKPSEKTALTKLAMELASITVTKGRVDHFKFADYEVPSIMPESGAREKVAVTLPRLPAELPARGTLIVPRQCDLLEYEEITPTRFFSLFDESERPLMLSDDVSTFFSEAFAVTVRRRTPSIPNISLFKVTLSDL